MPHRTSAASRPPRPQTVTERVVAEAPPLSEAELTSATVRVLAERSEGGRRTHVVGTMATAISVPFIIASLDASVQWTRVLPWTGLVLLASLVLCRVLVFDLRVPKRAKTVDRTLVACLVTGLVVGSVGWFDLHGLANESYAYAICAVAIAFCAGTLITLNPLSMLIAATVVPALISLATSLFVSGNLVPGICVLGVFGIIIKPLPSLRANVDELVRAQLLAHHAARHDPLTGLLNRNGLHDAFSNTRTVLYGDLDGFKEVNDRYGHSIGDHLLRELGDRIQKVADSHGCYAARLGGDEFVVMSPNSDPSEIDGVAAELLASTQHPFANVGRLSMSLGIAAVLPDTDLDTALTQADRALYRAKEHHGIAVWHGPDLTVRDLRDGVQDVRRR